MKAQLARLAAANLLILGFAVPANTRPLLAQPGTWLEMGPMPVRSSEMATGVIDGKIYAAGGYAGGGKLLLIYDPKRDQWERGPRLPVRTNHARAVAVQGRLYVFGGTEFGSKVVQIYDPKTEKWSRGTNMQTARTAMAVVAVGRHIHVMGGGNDIMRGLAMATHEVYHTATDSWSTRADLPSPTEHTAGDLIDGKIYVVGGRAQLGNVGALQIYDPGTDTWTAGAPLPEATSGAGVAAYSGKLYVYAGEEIGSGLTALRIIDRVQRYDPKRDTWEQFGTAPQPAHGVSAETVANQIFFLGGSVVSANNAGENFVVCLSFPQDAKKRPRRPSKLRAEIQSQDRVQLRWRDRSNDETSFVVQMKIVGQTKFKKVATVSPNVTKVEISGLATSTEYMFRVYARGETKRSKYSNKVRVLIK